MIVVFSFVAIACLVSLLLHKVFGGRTEHRQRDTPINALDSLRTIFVGVITHPGEESDCARLIHSAFENALAPTRVRVGVLHYVSEQGRSTGGIGMEAYFSNVRSHYERICVETSTHRREFKVIRRNAEDDQGREVSRAEIIGNMFDNEMYWCEALPTQRFASYWDVNAIGCVRDVGPRALLTTHPGDVFTPMPTYSVVIGGSLDEHRSPQTQGRTYVEEPRKSYEVPLVSPMFLFALSDVVRTCPPDPRFTFCDSVETLLRSARLATAGWTFHAPNKVLVQRYRASLVGADPNTSYCITKATTATARALRSQGIRAALSVLGEDACGVCKRHRAEHVTSETLNHPFEAMEGALTDRTSLLGSATTLSAFRKKAGVWLNKRPTRYAAHGVVRYAHARPSDEECAAKGFVAKQQKMDGDYA
jgi:hypothetical protein